MFDFDELEEKEETRESNVKQADEGLSEDTSFGSDADKSDESLSQQTLSSGENKWDVGLSDVIPKPAGGGSFSYRLDDYDPDELVDPEEFKKQSQAGDVMSDILTLAFGSKESERAQSQRKQKGKNEQQEHGRAKCRVEGDCLGSVEFEAQAKEQTLRCKVEEECPQEAMRRSNDALRAHAPDHSTNKALYHGGWVRIHGLSAAPELNGTVGYLHEFHRERGRWAVVLDGGKTTKLLRPLNLETLGHDARGSSDWLTTKKQQVTIDIVSDPN